MWMNKNQPAQNVSFNKFLRMSDPQEVMKTQKLKTESLAGLHFSDLFY